MLDALAGWSQRGHPVALARPPAEADALAALFPRLLQDATLLAVARRAPTPWVALLPRILYPHPVTPLTVDAEETAAVIAGVHLVVPKLVMVLALHEGRPAPIARETTDSWLLVRREILAGFDDPDTLSTDLAAVGPRRAEEQPRAIGVAEGGDRP
jgi:hypothetical protein